MEASFLKDADFIGKQDPLIKFSYQGQEFKTTTKDEAGKHAVWNELFILKKLDPNGHLVLKAFDEDPGCLEDLGEIKPIPIKEFMNDTNENKHSLDLFDKSNKKTGNLVFITQYAWVEADKKRDPELRPLNKKCTLELKIIDATFLKDADLLGK